MPSTSSRARPARPLRRRVLTPAVSLPLTVRGDRGRARRAPQQDAHGPPRRDARAVVVGGTGTAASGVLGSGLIRYVICKYFFPLQEAVFLLSDFSLMSCEAQKFW